MGLPQGWDFRATSGFVTDPSNDDFNDVSTTSGTSSNGIAWAWDQTIGNSRDRNASIDPRLAGCMFVTVPDGSRTFTVTLPSAGTYDITLALGDQGNECIENLDILDNGSVLFTVCTNVDTGAANHFIDATGVIRTSDTDWVTNNAKKRLTFTTTSAGFRLNAPSSFSNSMAHLRIDPVSGGSGGDTLMGAIQL